MLHYVGTKRCMADLFMTKVKVTLMATGKCIITYNKLKQILVVSFKARQQLFPVK